MIECPHCKMKIEKASATGVAHKHTPQEREQAIAEYKGDYAKIHTREEYIEFFKRLGTSTLVK